MHFDDRTIIACSSGLNQNYAIGVIRLSGFKDLKELDKYFSKDLTKIKPRYATFDRLMGKNNEVIDEVLVTFFKGPNSYTGENVLEISAHGNQLNIKRILSLFLESKNIRHAENGEFTLRALKNKKLDLSQVEGLDLLLNANSPLALKQGLKLLNGSLHNKYQKLFESYIKLKASVELSIDFSEDVGEQEALAQLHNSFKEFQEIIVFLNEKISTTSSSLINPEIVFLGKTNTGKSSFFNTILREDRAIVSDIAGTTRDSISEYINIDKFQFRVTDTAGIRQTSDDIEKLGIEKSKNLFENAFFKCLSLDASTIEPDEIANLDVDIEKIDLILISHMDKITNFENLKIFNSLKLPSSMPVIAFSNKSGSIGPALYYAGEFGPIGPELEKTNIGPIGPKAKLLSVFYDQITSKFNMLAENEPLLIERHQDLVNNICLLHKELQVLIDQNEEIAIVSELINGLGRQISELIGIVSPDEVLESIFSNFCIGK